MSGYGAYYSMAVEPKPVGDWSDYTWIVVCGGLASFFMAWGIGANDVANSFATSVGSRTLKLWQAMIIAAIFEFSGALGLGGETTKTVASDIANVAMFNNAPEIYMYGMLCSLTIAGCWLLMATYFLMPVSTTHSIIGAIMGFALVYGGWNGVLWNGEKGDFPYSKGFLPVVLSWFFSPIIGGILSAFIFSINRLLILRRENSTMKAIYSLPILIFFTLFINIMFVLAKGAKSFMAKTWPCDPKGGPGKFGLYYEDCSDLNRAAVWIAAVTGVGVAAIAGTIGIILLRRRYMNAVADEENAAQTLEQSRAQAAEAGKDYEYAYIKEETEEVKQARIAHNKSLEYPTLSEEAGFIEKTVFYVTFVPVCFWIQIKRGLFFDVFEKLQESDKRTKELHENAEKFNPHTEKVYQALQVLSACCVSFAHGSNDVANSIGPFSAILTVYQTYTVPSSKSTTPEWIFVLGGVGIVIGLIMYGYNIIVQLGVKMLHLTPSRGFAAELAAGLTISLASFFGIPVSTTQIIVGCEVGVALSEGTPGGGLNWKVFISTFLGWIWTIIVSLGACAILFCMGAYAPSIIQTDQLTTYRVTLLTAHESVLKTLNTTNARWVTDTTWTAGAVTPPMLYNGAQLTSYITRTSSSMSKLRTSKAYVNNDQVLFYAAKSLALFQNYSITAVGQPNAPAVTSGATPYVANPRP